MYGGNEKDFLEAVKLSHEVTEEEYEARPFYVKAAQFVLHLIAPLL